jgi:hypothetical protein
LGKTHDRIRPQAAEMPAEAFVPTIPCNFAQSDNGITTPFRGGAGQVCSYQLWL